MNPEMSPSPTAQAALEPCVMVIFGASGDLTQRKLLPALYRLATQQALPKEFAVVGAAGRAMSPEEFRSKMDQIAAAFSGGVEVGGSAAEQFKQGMHYLQSDFRDPNSYGRLAAFLSYVDRERRTRSDHILHVAAPPGAYADIVRGLDAPERARPPAGWTRIVIEKPFGWDLASAHSLNTTLHKVFDETQIYRLDDYLGKETVQNIIVPRFSIGIFEAIWNRRYIDDDFKIEFPTGSGRQLTINQIANVVSLSERKIWWPCRPERTRSWK